MDRLRGNTFLLLLLRAGKPELYDRPEFGDSNDGITRPNMLADLIRFTKPDYAPKSDKSLGVYFSKYLSGEKPESATYFPFSTPAFRNGLNLRLQSERKKVLDEMDAFCRKYLSIDKISSSALVAALVDAIIGDDTIEGSFDTGHKTVVKSDLDGETDFILQVFLLSVWNNILKDHPDASEGKATYKKWTQNNGFNTPQDVKTDIGSDRMAKISVSTILPEVDAPADNDIVNDFATDKTDAQNMQETEGTCSGNSDNSSADTGSEDDQDVEMDEEPEDPMDGTSADGETVHNTIINKGKIVHQNAQKIYNIDHIDTFYG